MDIQAVSGAATIAIALTIAFFAIAKGWQALWYAFPRQQSFADTIMRESAERIRRELNHLSRKQLTYLGAGLVFVLLFITAYTLDAADLYADYPHWQLNVLLGASLATLAYGIHRSVSTFTEWRRLSFQRDANLAIGHGLHRIASENGRVFHDVETKAGTIDHLIVGVKGVYAVHVLARRPEKDGHVVAEGGKLHFSNSDELVTVTEMRRMNSALSRELSAATGSDVKVRLVVAVPGWEIRSQGDGSLLLVNERNLPMIKGWRDTAEFLLNDIIAKINECLTARCCIRRRKAA